MYNFGKSKFEMCSFTGIFRQLTKFNFMWVQSAGCHVIFVLQWCELWRYRTKPSKENEAGVWATCFGYGSNVFLFYLACALTFDRTLCKQCCTWLIMTTHSRCFSSFHGFVMNLLAYLCLLGTSKSSRLNRFTTWLSGTLLFKNRLVEVSFVKYRRHNATCISKNGFVRHGMLSLKYVDLFIRK